MRTDLHIYKLTRTFLVSLTILFANCSTNVDEKKFLSEMGIDLTDKYETVTSSNQPAIGDQLIEFKLKISDKDVQAIKKKIESLENFQVVADNESPNRTYKGPNKKIEIFGWKRNETYSYEITKQMTSGFESYNLSLLPENILIFQWADE